MKKPQLSELTLREKIGQTAAVQQKIISEKVDNLQEFMKNNPYGSMWVMGARNIKNINMSDELVSDAGTKYEIATKEMVQEMNNVLSIPMLPAMDAETGIGDTFVGYTTTTCETGLGAMKNSEYIYELGKCVGAEAKCIGCEWIWGPVADNAAPQCTVSLGRGFSNDPDKIADCLCQMIKGIQDSGTVATIKHFPGVDKYDYRDAHISPSQINQTYDEWYERQGRAFKAGIDAGAYSIMISHTGFEALDDSRQNGMLIPATLSKKIITDELKGKMGFEGVVISDGICMRSAYIYCNSSDEELYIQALLAGNDVILGPDRIDYIDIIENAVKSGRIPESRIDDACQRVLDMKEKIGMFDENRRMPDNDGKNKAINATKRINELIAPQAISWVCNKNNLVPLDKDKIKNVQLVYTGYSEAVYKKLDFVKDEFEKYGAEVSIVDHIDQESIKVIAEKNDLIVYFAHIAPHSPLGYGGFSGDKCEQFYHIMTAGKEKSIGVSTCSPFIYHDFFAAADTFINAHGSNEETMRALVRGFYGDCQFTGTHPFGLDPLAKRI